jgi:xanthine dehydrogenase molybdenum-binding subunit
MADIAGANGTRSQFRVVGQPNIPGKLSPALATGVAKFGIDYVFPDMLHAKFLRSPYANARVRSIDASAALKIPGVIDVILWTDPEIAKLSSQGESFGTRRPWLDNLADYEGAEVGAIIVGESEDACYGGLSVLDVDWEILPHSTNPLEGRKEDAPLLREPSPPAAPGPMSFGPPPPPKKGNVNFANTIAGDVDAAMAKAQNVLEYELTLPAFASVMPNPSGSAAYWFDDPYYTEGGKSLHIEGAVRERAAIAGMYGLPPDKVVQEGLFMGGKYCDWGLRKSQEVTPFLAKRYNRPVRCVNNREETFDFIMMQRYMYMKIGYTDEGLITAVDDFSIADGGSLGSSSFGTSGDHSYAPYHTLKCKDIRQQMEIVDTNRGLMYVSGQHCPFNWDSVTLALYLIAEKLDSDPIDIARLNLHGPESQDDGDPVPSFDLCIEAGRKLMNWEPHRAGAKTLPDGRKHGLSFRYQMCPRHSFTDYTSRLEYRDGQVHLPTQGPLFGVYAVECNAMVVAEELGLNYDDVVIDFDYREKFTPVGGGSDGTTASAWVTKECANLLKKQILERAVYEADNPPPPSFFGPPAPPSPFAGYTAEELDLGEGHIFVTAKPEVRAPISSVKGSCTAHYQGKPPLAVWATDMGR